MVSPLTPYSNRVSKAILRISFISPLLGDPLPTTPSLTEVDDEDFFLLGDFLGARGGSSAVISGLTSGDGLRGVKGECFARGYVDSASN